MDILKVIPLVQEERSAERHRAPANTKPGHAWIYGWFGVC